jgi:hypothetical protein
VPTRRSKNISINRRVNWIITRYPSETARGLGFELDIIFSENSRLSLPARRSKVQRGAGIASSNGNPRFGLLRCRGNQLLGTPTAQSPPMGSRRGDWMRPLSRVSCIVSHRQETQLTASRPRLWLCIIEQLVVPTEVLVSRECHRCSARSGAGPLARTKQCTIAPETSSCERGQGRADGLVLVPAANGAEPVTLTRAGWRATHAVSRAYISTGVAARCCLAVAMHTVLVELACHFVKAALRRTLRHIGRQVTERRERELKKRTR